MKKFIYLMAMAISLCSCARSAKVMARYVPERKDDFVWENENIIYRAYGKALEEETLSPGFDVWVKKGGKLVADEWYIGAMKDPDYYHYDRGEGKDCYKVAKSLGGGASSPLVDGKLVFPTHNYDSYEICETSPELVSFVLHYPEWEVNGHNISLNKKITVRSNTNFCEVEDSYIGDFDSLTIAAGIIRHNVLEEVRGDKFFAFWEEASDQKLEPEEGRLGLALYMPLADIVELNGVDNHAVAIKTILQGEKLNYYFGSCWSKGNIATSEEWFQKVISLSEK